MNLYELIGIQKSGMLSIEKGENNTYVLGKSTQAPIRITSEKCDGLAAQLGWQRSCMKSDKLIEKTDKFISALSKHIKDKDILENTQLTFANFRRNDEYAFYDRIVMTCDTMFGIVILYNMKGAGGKYVVYDLNTNENRPIRKFKTAGSMAKWINTIKTDKNALKIEGENGEDDE